MTVYVRVTFDESVGIVTFLLDLVELETTNVDGIECSLLTCLGKRGFNVDSFNECRMGLVLMGYC